MRFTIRDLVYIGVFGALWGAVEIGLGSVWHAVNVPFSGVILSGIGLTVALIGRLFVPRTGSVFAIGLVTAFLKLFSLGGVVLSPMIAIVAESLFAELVLTAMRRPHRIAFVMAGALGTFWSLLHPFLTQGIIAGQGIVTIYTRLLNQGAKLLGLDPQAIPAVIAALIAVYLLIGAVAGWIAWDAGQIIQARLKPTGRVRESA